MKNFKNVLVNISLFIFTSVILLISLEILFRIFYIPLFSHIDPLIYKNSKNPEVIYLLKDNFKSPHGYVIKNGFRADKFYTEAKPQGVYRIISLGDSSTFGYGTAVNKDTYPEILEYLLNNKNKNNNTFEVINAGIPGYNTKQEFNYFIDRIVKFSPDCIIVGFMNNDFQVLKKGQKVNDLGMLIDINDKGLKIPLKNYLRLHSALYAYIGTNIALMKLKLKKTDPSEKNIRKFPFNPDEDDWKAMTENLIAFKKECDSKRIKLLVILFPHAYQLSDKYPIIDAKGFEFLYDRKYVAGNVFIQNRMKDICKKNNIDCLDLYTVLKKNWENLPYPKDDPVHPNAYGNLLISQEIIRHLYE